jgi:predicted class III extradiol MEMO1 family dioxygenase
VLHIALETLPFKTKSSGDFTHWKSPYGDLKVSDLNAEIMAQLPKSSYLVHNKQELEHSLEAIILFYIEKTRTYKLFQYWYRISITKQLKA